MKIIFLIAALFSAEMLGAVAANYCGSSLCATGVTHIACNHTGNFESSCSPDAAMVEIGRNLQQFIVTEHNSKRNYIATGNIAKFKPACRMATMRWDPELAKIASYNVRQCKMAHDKCRNTAKYKFSGQNLAWRSYTGTPNIQQLINVAINAWYVEYKYTTWQQLQSYPLNYQGPDIGHFTAMMGERNIAVGCAASTYSTNGVNYKTFLIACNYATTNMYNKPIYVGCARPAVNCKVGRNSKYPNLCAPKEVYNVNKW
ncbi:antigen 5 like allergen Cul n 1-like [Musca domestica]|uniref:Antigen 5 like allergen Cul n 1-like n=2 Tax=Musca domestica TaxID=7370 RepID=A0A9J7CW70_MUSDO|nr:antigen 5 like allergen Cul n 1-like [Musca domestica]